jgi:hypothetical protein
MPGTSQTRLLVGGIAAYVVALVWLIALKNAHGASEALDTLIFVPTVGLLLAAVVMISGFSQGVVRGPLVSVIYAFRAARARWRGMVGVVLLVAVALAILVLWRH